MDPPKDKAKSVFLNAAEIASGTERRAYIEAQCRDDRGLRNEVESLLQHHGQLGSFLEPAAPVAATCDVLPITEKPGSLVGPYKLLEQIGEGGMGLVFMARQREPVKRNVALKLIKPGMDSKQVIGRFEAERLRFPEKLGYSVLLVCNQTETSHFPGFSIRMSMPNGLTPTAIPWRVRSS